MAGGRASSGRGGFDDTETVCRLLRERARELAPELLPNGVRDGIHWKTSGMDDVATGRYSLLVDLSGPRIGRWHDFGGCRAGEEDGDMLDLVRIRMCGGDQGEAFQWARKYLGLTSGDRGAHERARQEVAARSDRREADFRAEQQRKRDGARGLWLGAEELPGSPAEAYLKGRSIDLRLMGRAPGSLRYRAEVFNKESGAKLPCLLAAIMGLDGTHLGTHRTWISARPDGAWGKALLKDAKRTLGPYRGGFIPLWRGDGAGKLATIRPGTPIHVSEGIEDGLSIAMAKPDARVIAAVSLSNLAALQLPDPNGPNAPGPVIIVGQRDAWGSPAVDALERAIGRLQQAGYRVQIIYPPAPFKDFNEWLQRDPQVALGGRGRAVA